jgi:hypothetical protein
VKRPGFMAGFLVGGAVGFWGAGVGIAGLVKRGVIQFHPNPTPAATAPEPDPYRDDEPYRDRPRSSLYRDLARPGDRREQEEER